MVRVLLSWLTSRILCPLMVIAALILNPVAAAEPEPVTVEITTHLGDQQTFVEGDVISFLLSLDRDAYVYLFYQDANANTIQIFPNRQSPNHYFQTGFFMPIPPPQTSFQFKVQAPFGREKLLVFASDNADIRLRGRVLKNGLNLINELADNLHNIFRSQSVGAFGSADMVIVSQPR